MLGSARAEAQSFRDHFYVSWNSPGRQSLERLILEISQTDLPVLIVGESGTGKEVVALQIHELSEYRELPLVKLSCTASGTEPFQSQLRNIENGRDSRNGKGVGTILFDEISELDLSCQRRVLHLFPEGNGLNSTQPFTGRILSCTARDLESEVRGGRFRSELFYRLDGVCLKLPPLRHLKEDVPALAQFFLMKYARIFHRPEVALSERTISVLVEYSWPGNIRELENVIKKIVALGSEEVGISDLNLHPSSSTPPGSILMTRSLKAAARAASQQAERELILETLTRTHWNRKKAAEALEISYKSLLYKLKQIQVPGSEEV